MPKPRKSLRAQCAEVNWRCSCACTGAYDDIGTFVAPRQKRGLSPFFGRKSDQNRGLKRVPNRSKIGAKAVLGHVAPPAVMPAQDRLFNR